MTDVDEVVRLLTWAGQNGVLVSEVRVGAVSVRVAAVQAHADSVRRDLADRERTGPRDHYELAALRRAEAQKRRGDGP